MGCRKFGGLSVAVQVLDVVQGEFVGEVGGGGWCLLLRGDVRADG